MSCSPETTMDSHKSNSTTVSINTTTGGDNCLIITGSHLDRKALQALGKDKRQPAMEMRRYYQPIIKTSSDTMIAAPKRTFREALLVSIAKLNDIHFTVNDKLLGGECKKYIEIDNTAKTCVVNGYESLDDDMLVKLIHTVEYLSIHLLSVEVMDHDIGVEL